MDPVKSGILGCFGAIFLMAIRLHRGLLWGAVSLGALMLDRGIG